MTSSLCRWVDVINLMKKKYYKQSVQTNSPRKSLNFSTRKSHVLIIIPDYVVGMCSVLDYWILYLGFEECEIVYKMKNTFCNIWFQQEDLKWCKICRWGVCYPVCVCEQQLGTINLGVPLLTMIMCIHINNSRSILDFILWQSSPAFWCAIILDNPLWSNVINVTYLMRYAQF